MFQFITSVENIDENLILFCETHHDWHMIWIHYDSTKFRYTYANMALNPNMISNRIQLKKSQGLFDLPL